MKLTGLLKNKVEEAQTKEEKKAIIAEAGIELTDEELEGVVGGGGFIVGGEPFFDLDGKTPFFGAPFKYKGFERVPDDSPQFPSSNPIRIEK